MTIQEILDLAYAEYGNRYQVTVDQLIQYLNIIQQIAFDKDLEAFRDYSNTLTVLQQIEFVSAGYTNAISTDVGKTVVQGSKTGTLRYYNNTTRKWAIETDDTFDNSTAVTITSGTGAGTTVASGAQALYRGPYDFPTDPLVRKLVGITKATDAQLYNVRSLTETGDDYGLYQVYSADSMWEKIRINRVGSSRTMTFIQDPSTTATYRWVYYKRAPVIDDESDDADLWIDPEYHWSLVYQGLVALCDTATYADKNPVEALKPYLEPYWESLAQQWTSMGGLYDYGISEGQPGA